MGEDHAKVVFVSSPFAGNVQYNVSVARAAARIVIDAGYVPIVPHLYIPQILDDDVPAERDLGLSLALSLLSRCDEMWCFGEPSAGMRMEIEEAERLDLPIRRQIAPAPAQPCWRCEGQRVVKVESDLPSFVPCPECTQVSRAG
jgi:hypothetical protein